MQSEKKAQKKALERHRRLDSNIVHPDFRLLLTSTPCDYFPITILQNGVKLTNEPPKGIKANLLKTYTDFDKDKFEIKENRDAWIKLLYSFSLFHAIILERAKFGPLGWNKIYDFNESDLHTSIKVLEDLLVNYPEEIQWTSIKFLTSDLNYGGRVTDDWDRLILRTIMNIFIDEGNMTPGFTFTASEVYFMPDFNTIDQYIEVSFYLYFR